jgi:hypothetical protein
MGQPTEELSWRGKERPWFVCAASVSGVLAVHFVTVRVRTLDFTVVLLSSSILCTCTVYSPGARGAYSLLTSNDDSFGLSRIRIHVTSATDARSVVLVIWVVVLRTLRYLASNEPPHRPVVARRSLKLALTIANFDRIAFHFGGGALVHVHPNRVIRDVLERYVLL